MTILFREAVFGPVFSRRLGYSLGINLLPGVSKICSFNCIYCECGWNTNNVPADFPQANQVIDSLEKKLLLLKNTHGNLDAITFAGNGEPTLHPQFPEITEQVISLRDKIFPGIRVVLLTNSSTLFNKRINEAISKIDLRVLKLDTAIEKTFFILNNPPHGFSFSEYVRNLKAVDFKFVVQTLFVRGKSGYNQVDNTTPEELEKLLEFYLEVKPEYVMVYTIDRPAPVKGLEKISPEELTCISEYLIKHNVPVKLTLQ